MVSASKLNNDFVRYEKDELEKLSNKECDKYVESLVAELMKNFKNGAIVDNPDFKDINDLIDSYMEVAKRRFANAESVLLDRKFRYLVNAYFTSNIVSTNSLYDMILSVLSTLVSDLVYCQIELKKLLMVYYDNYSNYGMLNDLFFNLSTVDGLNLTFDIHEKYLNNEFGVNSELMKDLNYLIESTVERYLRLIDDIEKLVDINEIAADDYFDKRSDAVKSTLKDTFKDCSDFERTALINSGFDDALLHQLENVKSEIEIVKLFVDCKEWFMNLYNSNNGFAEISADNFKILNDKMPERYNDFDEYMKKEPTYDLKKFELIESEINKIAF